MHDKSLQSCPTLCDPMDGSPLGSYVHGILQARILEWVTISSYRGSSRPRDRTQVSCIAGRFFTAEPLATVKFNTMMHAKWKVAGRQLIFKNMN